MIKRLFIQLYPQLILLLLVIIISLVNFISDTWLTGWDNLHPEFNFWLNIKRSIFAVWQKNQGLGHVGGHGHAAELPRQIILFFLSIFFPANLLRYAYNSLCLFFGSLGMYFLLKKIFLKNNKIPSLLGSLFYLLNLGTLQIFYIQYETFTTHFALLPWLFYSIFYFIFQNSKKSLLFFLIINFLASIQGFLPSLFFVYFFSLSIYLIIFTFLNKKCLKKILLLLFLTLITNSYWLLPFTYSASDNIKVFKEAKINRMSTEEHYLKSLKASNLENAILLKGLWFNEFDWQKEKNEIIPLMGKWVKHFSTKLARLIGYTIFLITLIGVIYVFIRKKISIIPVVILFFIFFTFFSNQTFPFSYFFTLYEKLLLFKDIFRLYFTKIAIITVFLYAIIFASGVEFLFQLQVKFLLKIRYFLTGVFITGLLLLSYPIFTGNLFYKNLKQKIPEEYFALFNFFSKTNQNEKILRLPLHTYVYWNFYHWGYRGSGFLWYGIANPILDRAFDVWSFYNEQAYREFSYALYSRNASLFEELLQKYRIGFILLDESVIDPHEKNSQQITFYRESKELISQIPSVQLDWQSNFLSLYKVKNEINEVELITNLPKIASVYRFTFEDEGYKNFGDYISVIKDADIYYPFRTFLNEKDKLVSNINLNFKDLYYQATMLSPKGNIILPALESTEADFFNQGGSLNFSQTSVYGKIPKQSLTIKPTDIEKMPLSKEINWKKETSQEKIRYESTDKTIGSNYDLSSLPQDLAYAINFKARNISGLPLRICIKSLYSKRCEIYDELSKNKEWTEDIFVLPPLYQGLGYELEISNISFGNISTINELAEINIVPLPYSFLKRIRVEKTDFEKKTQQKVLLSFTDFGFGKIINLPFNLPNETTLVFNQAYEKNWKAYFVPDSQFINTYFPFILGKEIKEHILINNWANGWKLPDDLPANTKIVIIFWPQYLQFLGFGLLLLTLIFALRMKNF